MENTCLSEQLKVSESSKVLDSLGQHPRTMPRAHLKLCSVSESQGEKRSEGISCSSEVCIAMVKLSKPHGNWDNLTRVTTFLFVLPSVPGLCRSQTKNEPGRICSMTCSYCTRGSKLNSSSQRAVQA